MTTFRTRHKDKQVFPTGGEGKKFKDADLRMFTQNPPKVKQGSLTSGNRLIIVGGPFGSGKSSFMRRLAADLDVDINEPGNVHKKGDIAIIGDYHLSQIGTDELANKNKFWPIVHDLLEKKTPIIIAEGSYVGAPRRDKHAIAKARELMIEKNYTPIVVNYKVTPSNILKRFYARSEAVVRTPIGDFKRAKRTAKPEFVEKHADIARRDNQRLYESWIPAGGISKDIDGNHPTEDVSHDFRKVFKL